MTTLKSICVYCGSAPGARPGYLEAARAFGGHLAGHGLTLVYGGSRIGCMRALADAALEKGGRVVGIMPRALMDHELGYTGLSELVVVGSMHERKAEMAARADAFVALPGGAGTLDELFEIWTWGQLGIHGKPIGLLDVDGYWRPLLQCLEHIEREGFLKPGYRSDLIVTSDCGEMIERLSTWQPIGLAKYATAAG